MNPSDPSSESSLRFEIGHVLFIDVVGYSKLLISEQTELLEHLKGMVRDSEQVRAAEVEGKLIRLGVESGSGGSNRGQNLLSTQRTILYSLGEDA
jgi:hypothetical protein